MRVTNSLFPLYHQEQKEFLQISDAFLSGIIGKKKNVFI